MKKLEGTRRCGNDEEEMWGNGWRRDDNEDDMKYGQ